MPEGIDGQRAKRWGVLEPINRICGEQVNTKAEAVTKCSEQLTVKAGEARAE